MSDPAVRRRHFVATLILALHCAWTAAATPPKDAEKMLAAIYASMAANNLARAQEQSDALVAKYPTFRLAHAVRGDLMMLYAGQMPRFGTSARLPVASVKIQDLQAEGAARLRSTLMRPAQNQYPAALLQMRPDTKHAILVDTSRSRLYLYSNDNGKPRLVTDYYASQGKRGSNKQTEGDQKTPLGIYTLTEWIPDDKLIDIYGVGAITTSYPNDWDRINRRTGSGIWVHGIPVKEFSEPPLSSNGCVVLSNPDLEALFALVDLGKTPIIISEGLRFVTASEWESERTLAVTLLNDWRAAADNDNGNVLRAKYSPYFKAENGNTAAEWTRRFAHYAGEPRDVSAYIYPAREAMLMISFTIDVVQAATNKTTTVQKRQYWAQDNGTWKIISESHL